MGYVLGRKPEHETLVFFRVKWLQATMKGTSSVRRLRLGSVCLFFCRIVTVASSCFGCACLCVVIGCFGICACRSHWNGCMTLVIWCSGVVLSADFLNFGANSFSFQNILLKSASKSSFCHFGVEIRFWSCNFRRCCA